jgi:hypothetical protein
MSDTLLLFPEKVVEGYKLRPMTLGQIQELVPYIGKIVSSMAEKGITVEAAKDRIDEILLSIMPYASEIIKIVIKEDDNIIKDFGAEKAATIFREIIYQNIVYLKNLSRPLEGAVLEVLSGK